MEIAAFIAAAFCALAAAFFFARWQKAEAKLSPLTEETTRLRADHDALVAAEAKLSALEKEIAQAREQAEKDVRLVKEQLPAQFENLAAKLLETSSAKLAQKSEESLGNLLNPLKERLGDFHKKVEESFGAEAKERFALKKEIESIVAVNERLTNALRGGSKTQGNWGEYTLELLLQSSGLREGEEYILQGKGAKLQNAGEARILPDVIINLPDSKHIIIDAKVSFTHYELYVNAENEAARELALAQFLSSVRAHVKGLSAKEYHSASNLGTPDFVLMFLPIEGAYALALQADKELFNFAWERKTAIVSPSTLMVTLKTIASIWKLERQNRNTLEIARQGGNLYDKFVTFVESMEKIGRHLKQTDASYDEAMNRLSTGHGNLVARAEKLRELGAKTSKALPEHLLSESGEAVRAVEMEKVG